MFRTAAQAPLGGSARGAGSKTQSMSRRRSSSTSASTRIPAGKRVLPAVDDQALRVEGNRDAIANLRAHRSRRTRRALPAYAPPRRSVPMSAGRRARRRRPRSAGVPASRGRSWPTSAGGAYNMACSPAAGAAASAPSRCASRVYSATKRSATSNAATPTAKAVSKVSGNGRTRRTSPSHDWRWPSMASGRKSVLTAARGRGERPTRGRVQ